MKNFMQQIICRYSCHFIAWFFNFLMLALLTVVYVLWYFHADKISIGTGQFIIWLSIFFVPSVIIPILLEIYVFTFCTLYYFEKKNVNFRIHNNYANNLFLQIIFLFLFILSVVLFLAGIFCTFYIIFNNNIYKQLFLLFGVPTIISVIPFYLFLIKKLKII